MPDTKTVRTLLNDKGQKILCLNVRSLYSNRSQLEADFIDTNIYALCLIETWLTPMLQTHVIDIDGFQLIRRDRQINKRGGGIAIYLRKDLTWSYLAHNLNQSNQDIEIFSIILERKYQPNLCISVIYLPPTSKLSEAIKHMDAIADTILRNDLHWVLCGDLNINLLDKKESKSHKLINNFTSRNLLSQLIKVPTRITPTTASLLDHIYTNLDQTLTSAGVIPYGLSDHDLIYIIIKKEPLMLRGRETFTCRKLNQYSIEALQYCLDNTDWSEFLNMSNVDVGWDMLYNILIRALSIVAPFVTMNEVKHRKTWTTPALLELIRLRDAEKEKADSLANNQTHIEFKKVRNRVKRKIIKDKKDYIRNKIDDASNNTRKYWKELNSLFKPSCSNEAQILLKSNNNTDLTLNEIPDHMITYFAMVGQNLANDIATDNSAYIEHLTEVRTNDQLIAWRPTNTEEISIIIDNIDITKSSMVLDIRTNLLKDGLKCCKDKICILFNRILTDGKFPDDWKQATITPIFKAGNKKQVSNYRPISLLSLLGKMMEKIIHTRLLNFLTRTNYFTPSQCGFRPNLGTNDSIAMMLNYVYNQMNNNNVVSAIFFDLSKAFDSIDHNILKLKLKAAGINGSCIRLLNSYLTNRSQITKVNNLKSQPHSITYGVPQGSTLGPLLFILFINDLPDYIKDVQISLYADDTAFYYGSDNLTKTTELLNIAANKFDEWCKYNKLTLNKKKCKSITFQTNRKRNLNNIPKIYINNEEIDHVNHFKYLGVILDDRLNFDNHIKMLKQKITSRLFTLNKIRWTLTFKDALLLYKTSILSYFDLGSLFYHSGKKDQLKSLQTLQNRALRIVYLKKEWPGTETAHVNCRLLTVKNRRELNLLKYAQTRSFNIENHLITHARHLRSTNKIRLRTQIPKNKTYEISYIHRSTIMWNSLPLDIKAIRNYKQFTTRVKLELLQNNLNFPE